MSNESSDRTTPTPIPTPAPAPAPALAPAPAAADPPLPARIPMSWFQSVPRGTRPDNELLATLEDVDQMIDEKMSPDLLATLVHQAMAPHVARMEHRLDQVCRELVHVKAVHRNGERRRRNKKAPHGVPWIPLVKEHVGRGNGLPLPPAEDGGVTSGGFGLPREVVDVDVGRVVEPFPTGFGSVSEMTHDDINWLAVCYNEDFGIVAEDELVVRKDKVYKWATAEPGV